MQLKDLNTNLYGERIAGTSFAVQSGDDFTIPNQPSSIADSKPRSCSGQGNVAAIDEQPADLCFSGVGNFVYRIWPVAVRPALIPILTPAVFGSRTLRKPQVCGLLSAR